MLIFQVEVSQALFGQIIFAVSRDSGHEPLISELKVGLIYVGPALVAKCTPLGSTLLQKQR